MEPAEGDRSADPVVEHDEEESTQRTHHDVGHPDDGDRGGGQRVATDDTRPQDLGALGVLLGPGVAVHQKDAHQGDADAGEQLGLVDQDHAEVQVTEAVARTRERDERGVVPEKPDVVLDGLLVGVERRQRRCGCTDEADQGDDPDREADPVATEHEPDEHRQPRERGHAPETPGTPVAGCGAS